jgi:hypothetical protein
VKNCYCSDDMCTASHQCDFASALQGYWLVKNSYYSVDMRTASHQCECVGVLRGHWFSKKSWCSVDMRTASHQCVFVSSSLLDQLQKHYLHSVHKGCVVTMGVDTCASSIMALDESPIFKCSDNIDMTWIG